MSRRRTGGRERSHGCRPARTSRVRGSGHWWPGSGQHTQIKIPSPEPRGTPGLHRPHPRTRPGPRTLRGCAIGSRAPSPRRRAAIRPPSSSAPARSRPEGRACGPKTPPSGPSTRVISPRRTGVATKDAPVRSASSSSTTLRTSRAACRPSRGRSRAVRPHEARARPARAPPRLSSALRKGSCPASRRRTPRASGERRAFVHHERQRTTARAIRDDAFARRRVSRVRRGVGRGVARPGEGTRPMSTDRERPEAGHRTETIAPRTWGGVVHRAPRVFDDPAGAVGRACFEHRVSRRAQDRDRGNPTLSGTAGRARLPPGSGGRRRAPTDHGRRVAPRGPAAGPELNVAGPKRRSNDIGGGRLHEPRLLLKSSAARFTATARTASATITPITSPSAMSPLALLLDAGPRTPSTSTIRERLTSTEPATPRVGSPRRDPELRQAGRPARPRGRTLRPRRRAPAGRAREYAGVAANDAVVRSAIALSVTPSNAPTSVSPSFMTTSMRSSARGSRTVCAARHAS